MTKLLSTLLDEVHAPSVIDYLSLDVEGLEVDILETFPFHRYRFLTITVEHNFVEEVRERIRLMLHPHGYRRKAVDYKHFTMWDDLYVHESIPQGMPIVSLTHLVFPRMAGR